MRQRSSSASDAKQKEWFVFDHALVLPEYLVEFDYATQANNSAEAQRVAAQRSGRDPPLTTSSSAALLTSDAKQKLAAQEQQASQQRLQGELAGLGTLSGGGLSEQEIADLGPLVRPLLKFLERFYRGDKSEQNEQQQQSDAAGAVDDARLWPATKTLVDSWPKMQQEQRAGGQLGAEGVVREARLVSPQGGDAGAGAGAAGNVEAEQLTGSSSTSALDNPPSPSQSSDLVPSGSPHLSVAAALNSAVYINLHGVGLEAVEQCMARCRSLKKLVLSFNKIKRLDGLLAMALMQVPLEELDLSYNMIPDQAIAMLQLGLGGNDNSNDTGVGNNDNDNDTDNGGGGCSSEVQSRCRRCVSPCCGSCTCKPTSSSTSTLYCICPTAR